ncbi:MAG: P-loop NTPase [Isosphaeraceae bacterium]|nr:P-loop NTPase [Isosphaeraceae bacterium]
MRSAPSLSEPPIDQADRLRRRTRETGIAEATPNPSRTSGAEVPTRPEESARATRLVFCAGKGGVGTSVLAANLAWELARLLPRSVALVDADLRGPQLGRICGAPGDRNEADDSPSLRVVRNTDDPGTILERFDRVHDAIPPATGARRGFRRPAPQARGGFVIVDVGTGWSEASRGWIDFADQVVLVTTTEPTSIDASLARIREILRLSSPREIRVLVNQATSRGEADEVVETLILGVRSTLRMVATSLGSIPIDRRVPRSVRLSQPFVSSFPHCPAARGIQRLARRLVEESRPRRLGPWADLRASLTRRFARETTP